MQYDCIFVHEISNKIFGEQDMQNLVEYVENGRGLLIGLRGWLYKHYG
jgi:hypothetical protein